MNIIVSVTPMRKYLTRIDSQINAYWRIIIDLLRLLSYSVPAYIIYCG